jgi:hypothetical protein
MKSLSDPSYIKNFFLIVAASLSIVLSIINPDTDTSTVLYGIFTISLFLLTITAAMLAPGDGLEDATFIDRIIAMLPIIPLCVFTLILFIMHIEQSDNLNSNNMPETFIAVKVINVLFYICALVCIWKYLEFFEKIASDKIKFSNNPGKAKDSVTSLKCKSFNMSAFTVLFSTCAGISTMFMYSIIKYFSTDGFSTYQNTL